MFYSRHGLQSWSWTPYRRPMAYVPYWYGCISQISLNVWWYRNINIGQYRNINIGQYRNINIGGLHLILSSLSLVSFYFFLTNCPSTHGYNRFVTNILYWNGKIDRIPLISPDMLMIYLSDFSECPYRIGKPCSDCKLWYHVSSSSQIFEFLYYKLYPDQTNFQTLFIGNQEFQNN